MKNIIRTRYAVRVVGSGDALVPYDLDYCEGLLSVVTAHAELVRIDHVESDFATTGLNWTTETTVVRTVNTPVAAEPVPSLWVETNVRKTARECIPGTVVWLTVGGVHGVGWKVVTVKEWCGMGNGYASLFSTDGTHCGQFLETDLLEVQPA